MRVTERGLMILSACLIAAVAPGGALASDSLDELPRSPAEAAAYYESDPDLWGRGPVQYLLLEGERKMLNGLLTRAQRAEFIQWFWDRRDPDLRVEGNPVRAAFYARVAEANRKYHDFPRGWKSDRGLVHIVLGRPDSVRPTFGYASDATIWTYYTVGPNVTEASFGSLGGEIAVAFLKSNRRAGYQVYGGFGGPGVLPLYVRDALNYAKLAAISDPFLKASFTD
jgi:GWxTD domain-containing protein